MTLPAGVTRLGSFAGGKGDKGDQGEPGLPAPEAIPTVDFVDARVAATTPALIAAEAADPETELHQTFVGLAAAAGGGYVHVPFATLGTPRPSVPPGTKVWWHGRFPSPHAQPVFAVAGDVVQIEDVTPIEDSPLVLYPGTLQGWWPASEIAASPAADGGLITSIPDLSGNSRTQTPMATGSNGWTTTPTRSDNAFGADLRGIGFADYSGLRCNPFVTPTPEAFIAGVNVIFDPALAAGQHEVVMSFSSVSADGLLAKYSIGRNGDRTRLFVGDVTAGLPIASAHLSGTMSFASPMSLLMVQTATRIQLWAAVGAAAAAKVIDQDLASTPQTLTATSVAQIGFNASNTSNARRMSVRGAKIGEPFVATPTAADALDTARIGRAINVLRRKRGVTV